MANREDDRQLNRKHGPQYKTKGHIVTLQSAVFVNSFPPLGPIQHLPFIRNDINVKYMSSARAKNDLRTSLVFLSNHKINTRGNVISVYMLRHPYGVVYLRDGLVTPLVFTTFQLC
jgi:hypothetical protein